jgi:N-acetylglucosaminyl-diphospho-decaprenol L-rhamnosyltransferase
LTASEPASATRSSVVVSIIVVTWNSTRVIGGFLDSLAGAGLPDPWELIVVDNDSADDTVATVRSRYPSARVIANDSNLGLAAANNQGIDEARGEFLMICNPDVIFRAGAAGELVATMNRHPRAAWVVPRLTYEDGSLQTSAGDLPTFLDAVSGRQVTRQRSDGEPSGFWWDGWAHDEERVIGRGHEAAYLVRRKAVDDVGPQDPRYVLDWEGVDWTERFTRAGWEVWLAPGADVIHLGGDSIRTVPFRSVVLQHRGMYLYFSSRRSIIWKPVLAVVFALRAAFKIALVGTGTPLYRMAYRKREASRETQR